MIKANTRLKRHNLFSTKIFYSFDVMFDFLLLECYTTNYGYTGRNDTKIDLWGDYDQVRFCYQPFFKNASSISHKKIQDPMIL